MRLSGLLGFCMPIVMVIGAATTARAQSPEPKPEGRQSTIEKAAAEKAKSLHPYEVTFGERVIAAIERPLTNQTVRWHPYFRNAYEGGGFAAGLGYTFHTSAYSTLDVRGSYSINSFKLAEAEYVSPRLFDRRGELTILGGWRDATQVPFHGIGMNTASGNAMNYGFEQPFGSAMLTIRPTRELFILRGGFEASRWDLKAGAGTSPSVDKVYTAQSLAGLDTRTTYLHTQATIGIDSRHSAGYTRRGGFYGVTGHDYTDRDDALGFRQVDYEAIQHFPILREAWVVSLHGLVTTTFEQGDQATPFYMMPSLGGGSTLRGFSSSRFSDRHSLLLQAGGASWPTASSRARCSTTQSKVAARTSILISIL